MSATPDPKPSGSPAQGGIFKLINDLLNSLIHLNPRAAVVVIVLTILMFSLAAFFIMGVRYDGFDQSFDFLVRAVGIAALAGCAGWLLGLAAWVRPVLTLCVGLGVLYAGLFFGQVLTNNQLPYMRAACFIDPRVTGCALAEISGAAVDSAEATTPDAVMAALDVEAPAPDASDGATTEPEVIVAEPFSHEGPVYVQFAGAIERETVAQVSQALYDEGWNVQAPSRGGERLAAAAGLNEIRYFRAEDREAALHLAADYANAAPWVTAGALAVRDLSAGGFNVRPGVLEVWTSLR